MHHIDWYTESATNNVIDFALQICLPTISALVRKSIHERVVIFIWHLCIATGSWRARKIWFRISSACVLWCKDIAACAANNWIKTSSKTLKGSPVALLMAWMTAMSFLSFFFVFLVFFVLFVASFVLSCFASVSVSKTGQHKIFLVRNPVFWSVLESNLGSV